MSLPDHIHRTLAQLTAEDRLRHIPTPQTGSVDFCSNDYLGLARNPAPVQSLIGGAAGARLLAGTHPPHLALEAACTVIFGSEAALLYNSGYQANVGLLSAIGQRADIFLYDAACHASIKDGMRLSLARHLSFAHNDLLDLERLLLQTSGNRYIVVERLYSMDGDICDWQGLCKMADKHGAWLVVDEAHSAGIMDLEPNALEHGRLLARMVGFGKAVGQMGAVVLGAQQLIDFLVNRSRAWIYSTAMPPALAQAILGNLNAIPSLEPERQRLLALRKALEEELQGAGFEVTIGASPIYPLLLPGNSACKALASKAQANGYDVRAILSPTVPSGSERIRIVLHSYNSIPEIKGLVRALRASA